MSSLTHESDASPLDVVAPTRAERRAARRRRSSESYRVQLIVGSVVLALMCGLAILVPLLSTYGPDQLAGQPLQAPSADHLFGTDTVGRDVFTRVFAAARIDLIVVVLAVLPIVLLGALLGAFVAMTKSRVADVVLMRATDVVVAFPFIVLVLVLVVLFGADKSYLGLPAGLPSFLLAFYMLGWAFYARLGRAETKSLRTRDYIAAARVLGYSPRRVLWRHVLPPVIASTLTLALADMVATIAVMASLPFLGAGVQPPTAEWGAMMYEGRTVLETAWWVTVAPGVALLVTGVALTFVGDALIARRSAR